MDKLKQWVALTVLAVLAIGAGSWFLLVSPKKSEASDLNLQADSTTAASTALRNDIKALQAQAKALPRERGKLAAVAAKLPAEAGMPALIRALTAAADASGVKFVSLKPGAPVAAIAPAAPVKATTTPEDGEAATTTKKPVAVASGLVTIPVEIAIFGGFYEAQAFAAELEDLPRAFRVTKIDIKPGADPGASGGANPAAATDGQHLMTLITGEVFMSSAPAATTSTAVVASGTAS